MIIKMRIIGEKSIPPIFMGNTRRILLKTGSVISTRNLTIGLYGSAPTQDMTALPIMAHIYRVKRKSNNLATAIKKLLTTNIQFSSLLYGYLETWAFLFKI
jgi:hypothetical protein